MRGLFISNFKISKTYQNHETWVDLLRFYASERGEELAYTFLIDGEEQSESLSFAQLHKNAQKIALSLRAQVGLGERVLLLFPPSLDYISSFLGCLYAGTIPVPAYPPDLYNLRNSLARLEMIVSDCQAKIALSSREFIRLFQGQVGGKEGDFFRQATPTLLSLRWVSPDETVEGCWERPPLNGKSIAFLQYTSGSTGQPKGVVLTHQNILYNAEMEKQAFAHHDKTVCFSWLPLYHDMGLIGNILQALYLGRPCIFMSPLHFLQRPVRWLKAISRYQATTSGGPNFAYELCCRKITPEECSELNLNSWEVAFNGAEPIRASTIHKFSEIFSPYGFRRTSFHPCYGLAEATLFVSGGQARDLPCMESFDSQKLQAKQAKTSKEPDQVLVSSGQTVLEQKIIIVDPEKQVSLPFGQIGEIWLSGPHIANCYWQKEELSQDIFCAALGEYPEKLFLRTGDLGFFHKGNLFIAGRIKDLIILSGQNYYPQDIERVVEESDTCLRPGCSAAFSLEENDQEKLIIVAELRDPKKQENLPWESIISKIRLAISREFQQQVETIVLLPPCSLPKTSSGKIQRHTCRKKFLENIWKVLVRKDS